MGDRGSMPLEDEVTLTENNLNVTAILDFISSRNIGEDVEVGWMYGFEALLGW